jgi:putative spermidine/putrescine transport system ATP-binding protein/spermidine/putrescine transport system ATP-binding protein
MLGPSGCGKTTTLRMIGGFEFPDSGRVLLDGDDVTEWPAYKRPVNMMFQDFALFPHMTVARNIGYGLSIAGVPRGEIAGRVAEALETIELPDKAESLPSQLSNGQKQRVALARALIRRPKVLLLDEPMSALDAKLREAMQVELKHLHEKLGITFILVTHDQTEALVMSDRVVVMDRGRIVQVGAPSELYDHPATPYVANFLGTSNLIVAKVAEAGGEEVAAAFGANTIRVAANGARPQVGAEVMLCIRPEKVRLLDAGGEAPAGFNRLSGVILEQFFHGDSIRLALDIDGGKPLVIHRQLEQALGQADLPPAGRTVELALDPRSVTLFEEVTDFEPGDGA